ncbi:PPE family protein [Mycobacterium lacus]|uniref:Putative PPE family protein PPE37 n=1 Tax=Mycobacterium lacus TaxID=169765 RepID=A0A1X1Y1A9_9MYCO|nr:PPE family protein [Mycobacterium lacus]MCV7123445.1 PPE family protein [Mycobacterium lacus]ORW04784.1 hypothetical protein AWC15_02725 [Mycobacterium lacus]BBX96817.1 putative PPE family protein PPE37 [Mycobacterium lacus]
MPFPMWFALPPEVHSARLSTGAGPGPLLAAAAAWHGLAVHYSDTATELAGILAAVQGGAWEGPSAERFVAAHQPFLYWLREASAVASAAAGAHEAAAAGYTSALGAMPTLAELAANHAVHGALVATNFFGVNTIPIALNEADYLRMWIQAATAMNVYQAVSEEGLTAPPTTPPAPRIVAAEAASDSGSSFPDPTKLILQLLKDLLEFLRNLAAELLSGPLGNLVVQALDALISFVTGPVFTFLAYLVLDPLIYFGPFTTMASPVLLPVGLSGLAGLCAIAQDPVPLVESVHSDEPGQRSWPATTGVTLAGTGNAAAPVATAAPAATASAAPASPPAPGFGAAQGFYAVGGPDGEGFAPIATTKGRTGVAADAAAAAALAGDQAAASVKKAGKARGRLRHYRFEFLEDGGRAATSDAAVAEQVAAGDRGMDALGFTGTIPKSVAGQAKGLMHLGGGEFAEAPHEPMLPRTWSDQQ